MNQISTFKTTQGMLQRQEVSKLQVGHSGQEVSLDQSFEILLKKCPIPDHEKINNLGLFIKRQNWARMLFMYELYKKIINVHGVIIEFGVRWGQNLVLFESFRGLLEPFNYNRKIIGFDTFEGFPSVAQQDNIDIHQKGEMSVVSNYDIYLDEILQNHEKLSPIAHMRKYDIIKGDAIVSFKKYLEQHPETIIAFAYFDFDIYEPTKVCLELCKDRLTKGSIIGFDELNHPDWPGETLAVNEVLGLKNIKIQRMPFNPTTSFVEIE